MMVRRTLNELKEIKAKLVAIELGLLKSERATRKDIKRVKAALKEYKEGKTILLNKTKKLE
jgi:vancomycin permeability regulator SanA